MKKLFFSSLFISVFVLPLVKFIAAPVDNKEIQPVSQPFKIPAVRFFTDPKKQHPQDGTAELKQSNWYAEAMNNIAQSEYQFKWDGKTKTYCTPNRKNNLRFFYDENGFAVEPGTTRIPVGDASPDQRPDEIKYHTTPNWKVRFNLDRKQAGPGTWQVTGNKAEYITKNITVQYINNGEGMRQNFIVQSPPTPDDELKINFTVATKLKTSISKDKIQFSDKKNSVVLNYEQLKVWDANGRELEAAIGNNKDNCSYYIRVNTSGATYPITVDPLSTTPAATLESNLDGAFFGESVSSAGDINGDGYSDVIVGAAEYDNGQFDEGAAFIYYGSAAGISTVPATILESNSTNAFFGISVASAGDVNKDGYSDVIVGASSYNNGSTLGGAAFVFQGSAAGINATPVIIGRNQAFASFGNSVASAGDVNGDGYSDVIVGAFRYDNGQQDEGAVFVYHGSAAGINTTAATTMERNQVMAQFGSSVASAGDINGDGYSDIIAGAFFYDNGQANEGAAFVYYGAAAGINTSTVTIMESNQANANMGVSVSSAGDVNGDGYSDVIAGAYRYSNGQNDEGVAFVYHGSATGVNTTAATTLENNQAFSRLGISVASAGDINGDGYSDVIAGAFFYDNGEANEGAAFVYYGAAAGINSSTVTIMESNQANAQMGISVSSAGDVNGDGFSDVIAGAYFYDNGQTDEGAAFVYHGAASGLSATPNSTPDDADQAFASFGYAVAGAGDVNGDGYSDVIIGAYTYNDGANADEGRAFVYYGSAAGLSATPNNIPDDADQANANFGISVAGAGDVNGDGYSDVIIGANLYNDGANTDEGRAFVYYGSATGLSATPNSTPDDANQGAANFGISVACAGDVNGDGYSDVIIGANLYNDGTNNDEGRAFVYYGSTTGLSATPNSTPDDANQVAANFGISAASAGDVNGDGYSDVIIGADQYDDGANSNEGRAFVYYGSATGLSATPNNIPDDANQAAANFGISAASAGDVNGDGYSDVIVGAYKYDDGANSNEGRAFVYHGSATGLSAAPNNIIGDADQTTAQFGIAVANAGDVNGDGYCDVIIGADGYDDGATNNEGRAFVYHGSAAGLSATPNSTPDDADKINARFGYSAAGAGDVNGDGYSDVIIGAPFYDDGTNTGEGRAFLYYGNSAGATNRSNLFLYNTDLITPISKVSFNIPNFGAGLFAKSFLGRQQGKLVWETEVNYGAYSGNPITNSVVFTSQQAAYSNLGLTGTELKTLVSKISGARFTKIRARIKYNPVTAITGQLYGPWHYVPAQIAGTQLGVLPVDLLSFSAAWLHKGKIATITFSTDKESGTCCFDIEKSSDGVHYSTIGAIAARNISGVQQYHFTDNNATAGKQYYRLKINETGGQFTYSSIQLLQYSGSINIFIFPNPATNVLQLQLNNVYDKMNVRVVNSAGQIVKQLNNIYSPGQTISIPVSNLASGIYWIYLQSGDEKQVLQFVKQ